MPKNVYFLPKPAIESQPIDERTPEEMIQFLNHLIVNSTAPSPNDLDLRYQYLHTLTKKVACTEKIKLAQLLSLTIWCQHEVTRSLTTLRNVNKAIKNLDQELKIIFGSNAPTQQQFASCLARLPALTDVTNNSSGDISSTPTGPATADQAKSIITDRQCALAKRKTTLESTISEQERTIKSLIPKLPSESTSDQDLTTANHQNSLEQVKKNMTSLYQLYSTLMPENLNLFNQTLYCCKFILIATEYLIKWPHKTHRFSGIFSSKHTRQSDAALLLDCAQEYARQHATEAEPSADTNALNNKIIEAILRLLNLHDNEIIVSILKFFKLAQPDNSGLTAQGNDINTNLSKNYNTTLLFSTLALAAFVAKEKGDMRKNLDTQFSLIFRVFKRPYHKHVKRIERVHGATPDYHLWLQNEVLRSLNPDTTNTRFTTSPCSDYPIKDAPFANIATIFPHEIPKTPHAIDDEPLNPNNTATVA